jgi:hypothetical protein
MHNASFIDQSLGYDTTIDLETSISFWTIRQGLTTQARLVPSKKGKTFMLTLL